MRILVVAMVEATMAMVAMVVVLTLVAVSTVARKGMLKYVLQRVKGLLIYQ